MSDFDDDLELALHHVSEKADEFAEVYVKWVDSTGINGTAAHLALGIQLSHLGAVGAVAAGIGLEAYVKKCREFYITATKDAAN